jgi:hypothetical protein
MDSDKIFDLSRIMEGFIDEGMEQIDIMRELLNIAEHANINSGYTEFRIGDDVYTLKQLEEIQELEEHDVLFKKR